MVERQVYGRNKVTAAQMKGPEKEKWEGMTKRMAEFEKEKPSDLPTAFAMTDVGHDVAPMRLLPDTCRRSTTRTPSSRRRRKERPADGPRSRSGSLSLTTR
jgi:hypothetical protein